MKGMMVFKRQIVGLVCIGLLVAPSPLLAAGPLPGAVVSDVALGDGGTLLGQVVDPQGTGLPAAPVSIRHKGLQIVALTADKSGSFAVAGLNSGTYQVGSGENQGAFRLWAANAAPPAAQPRLLIVTGDKVVRGNDGACGGSCAGTCDTCGPCDSGGCGGGWWASTGGLKAWILPALVAGGIIGGVAAITHDSDKPPVSP